MVDLSRIDAGPGRGPAPAAGGCRADPGAGAGPHRQRACWSRGGRPDQRARPRRRQALHPVPGHRGRGRDRQPDPATRSPGPGRSARTAPRSRRSSTTALTGGRGGRRGVRRPVDDDAPIVKLVNRVLADAVRLSVPPTSTSRSSATRCAIRYRVDGLLRDVMTAPQPDRQLGGQPDQDHVRAGHRRAAGPAGRPDPVRGRGHGDRRRVSTLPSLHGEKVVIRLLTRGDDVPPLASLGFEPEQLGDVRARAVRAAGPGADHRPDRLGQDEHAVLRDRRDQVAGEEHRHAGGSGRGPAGRDHPGRREHQDRA